ARTPPTVSEETDTKAEGRCVSRMSRVTSSASYGTTCVLRKCRRGKSARVNCAATRSSAELAASPARASPLRNGVARAINWLKLANEYRIPPSVWPYSLQLSLGHYAEKEILRNR